MAKTSSEIEAQIAKLQRDLKAVKAKEVRQVVDRIREAVAHYGLTAADIFGGTKPARRKPRGAAKAPKPAAKAAKAATKAKQPGSIGKVAIKFDDGAGNTWTGRGSMPRWLKAAVAEGKKPDDLRIAS